MSESFSSSSFDICRESPNNIKSSLLDESEILFHNAPGAKLYHDHAENEKFGILRLRVAPGEIAAGTIAMIFTIDCSASMTDYCSDNKTKLEHAKHTMTGIINYLAEVVSNSRATSPIYVAILTFSTKTKLVSNFVEINEANNKELIDKVSSIRMEDSTNIEIAIKEADKLLREFSKTEQGVSARKYHIQLTDGEVTHGECDHDKLAAMVNRDYDNIFVGFGNSHDDQLLCKLSENPRNDYRFIDKIQYSSIVYGEILYNILYRKYDCLEVNMIGGGEIYDWRTNSWETKLLISNLSCDSERVFQVRTFGEKTNVEAHINDNTNREMIALVYCLPDLVDIEMGEISNINDLTKYSFRQKTQELLFEIRKFIQNEMEEKQRKRRDSLVGDGPPIPILNSEDDLSSEDETKKILHEKCRVFIRTIKEYMKEKGLMEDRFLRLLQDDIYIVFKTLYRRNAHMWCTTRQMSLGRDHSYQPTQFLDDENNNNITWAPNRMRRNLGRINANDPDIFPQTFPLFDEEDEDNLMQNLTQNFDLDTMSPSLARTIHGVSTLNTPSDAPTISYNDLGVRNRPTPRIWDGMLEEWYNSNTEDVD